MFVLNRQNSIANVYLAEIRDVNIQGDGLRFRHNIRRLGFLLGYEMSKQFDFSKKSLTTPLTNTEVEVPDEDIVVITIMRAGLPFQEGFLQVFDHANSGFIGAWRKEGTKEVEIDLNYLAAPDLNNKTVILADPMLATGKSLVRATEALTNHGTPKSLHLASVIAAPEGVNYLNENLKVDFQLWTCALDEKLNNKSYIVPGLGDAGDLAYGTKL